MIALPDPEAAWEAPRSKRALDPAAEVRRRIEEALAGGALPPGL